MGTRQYATIERAVSAACKKVGADGTAPALCATLAARSAAGAEVWVQVMAGTVNLAYPFADDPVARLRQANAFATLEPSLIGWEANAYATFDTGGIAARDIAFCVDRIFTKVLGCDDATYEPQATMEDLDA